MTFENKELSRAWKIVFIKTIPPEDETVKFRFLVGRVESPAGENPMPIKIVIPENIIENKLKTKGFDLLPGYDAPEKFQKMVLDNEELFMEGCLIKIEQSINNNSLETELPVDANWIKATEKGHLKPLSRRQDRNTYIYMPEKRIGFK